MRLGKGVDAVRERWAQLPLGLRREVIRVLVTVALDKGKVRQHPGGRYFDESTVRIEWRQ